MITAALHCPKCMFIHFSVYVSKAKVHTHDFSCFPWLENGTYTLLVFSSFSSLPWGLSACSLKEQGVCTWVDAHSKKCHLLLSRSIPLWIVQWKHAVFQAHCFPPQPISISPPLFGCPTVFPRLSALDQPCVLIFLLVCFLLLQLPSLSSFWDAALLGENNRSHLWC